MRVFQRVPAPAKQLTADQTRKELAEPPVVGPSAATSSSELERHVDVPDPVVVELDRQLRALDPQGREELRSTARPARCVGSGCDMRPNAIRPSARSSRTGTTPFPVSSLISSSCSGAARTNAVPSVG